MLQNTNYIVEGFLVGIGLGSNNFVLHQFEAKNHTKHFNTTFCSLCGMEMILLREFSSQNRKRLHMKKGLLGLVLCLFAFLAQSQKGYEIGGWLGLSNYFGDLNTNYRLSKPGPAGGFIGRYDINYRMAVKFSANYGLLRADDADSDNSFEKARNLSFKSNVFEGALQYEFHFFPYVHGSDDHYFTPYLFLGLSGFHFDPKAKYNGSWERLRPLGTEGQQVGNEYSSVGFGLAYGLGLKFDLNYYWSVNIELSARSLFTDYLDDISETYPDLVNLAARRGQLAADLSDRSGEINDISIGELGRQRGNANNNDAYAFLSFGLVYFIPFLECPTISKPY